jgi:hypothetical protein
LIVRHNDIPEPCDRYTAAEPERGVWSLFETSRHGEPGGH